MPPLPELPPPGETVGSVVVRAPLSIANVGPGFDHFGLCLEGPADTLELRRARATELEVIGDGTLPRDPRRNVATLAATELFRLAGGPHRFHARLIKGYRGGSGIGSSGASAVAGALAAAALLALDREDPRTAALVLRAALVGEQASAGSEHLDNVAASLFGGFVLVEAGSGPRVCRIPPPPELRVVVALPDVRVETRYARSLLPRTLPFSDAVANVARASALVHGLLTGDLRQVGRNLTDRVAEPYRTRPLAPGLERARALAVEAGAWGVALAGSGPALFALAPPARCAAVAKALVAGLGSMGLATETFSCGAGEGARVLGWG